MTDRLLNRPPEAEVGFDRQAVYALDHCIDRLNRERMPDRHGFGHADEEGYLAAARLVKSLRPFAGARRGFKRRLFSGLGKPVALLKLQAGLLKLGTLILVLAIAAALILVVIPGTHERYQETMQGFDEDLWRYTIDITVTPEEPGGPLSPAKVWEAAARESCGGQFVRAYEPWYALDSATGSVLVRERMRQSETGIRAVSASGQVTEHPLRTGHLLAFSQNEAGLAYVAHINPETTFRTAPRALGPSLYDYLDSAWLSPAGETVWNKRLRWNLGDAYVDTPAALSLDPDGQGLLASFFAPSGRGVTDPGGPRLVRVDGSGEVVAEYSPGWLPAWAVDWGNRRVLLATGEGSRTRLFLLDTDNLDMVASGEVAGRLEGRPATAPGGGLWWLYCPPAVHLVSSDLQPVLTIEGRTSHLPVGGFSLSGGGWCIAWTDLERVLVTPGGEVAWRRDRGSSEAVLSAACAADGSYTLMVSAVGEETGPDDAARPVVFELLDATGSTVWTYEALSSNQPVVTFVDSRHVVVVYGAGRAVALDLLTDEIPEAREHRLGLAAFERAWLAGDGRYLLLETGDYSRITFFDLAKLFSGLGEQ